MAAAAVALAAGVVGSSVAARIQLLGPEAEVHSPISLGVGAPMSVVSAAVAAPPGAVEVVVATAAEAAVFPETSAPAAVGSFDAGKHQIRIADLQTANGEVV